MLFVIMILVISEKTVSRDCVIYLNWLWRMMWVFSPICHWHQECYMLSWNHNTDFIICQAPH